ncbi:FMN-dependent NADH-azoreductase [Streptomyces sp. NBC_00154]|uniref:FMN-dependent NADH-azoreductase n=1 Tax=Streptomyces sp. NBC_00154 TaxID=2975670 RepID=UPI00224F9EC8|nr:NAD(P)H-dependent oxidoreductase [Streptomyces sp. NBC_00154]MCX5317681.1 NAD(P)H-dependent oxidoreductase [Streptomyces sp. NBC_00154]
MPHLLHIDSSARSTGFGSASRRLSAQYVDAWKAQNPGGTVTYRDVTVNVPDLVSEHWVRGVFGPAEIHDARSDAAVTAAEKLIAEVKAADVLALGVPVYNFNVPASFKAWIDQISMAGRTFSYTADGPQGLLEGKKVAVLRSSGSDFSNPRFAPLDFHEPYIRGILGFLGITDVEFISVNGMTEEQLAPHFQKATAAIANSVGTVA